MHDKENQHCAVLRSTENSTTDGVDGYTKVPRMADSRGFPEAPEDPEQKKNSFKDPEVGCTDPMAVPFRKGATAESLRRRRWTTLERYLGLASIVLLLTCLALVVIAFTQALRKEKTALEICTNQHCVITAAKILEAIDTTFDPCEDFFQFACGSWNRRHIIPEDKTNYNTFEKLHDQLQVGLKGLLEEPIGDEDTEATTKSKTLYASCMNTSEIEKMGDAPLRGVIQLLGGWPVINPNWENETTGWVLEKVIGSLRGVYNIALLIDLWVAADDKNSSINVITLDQPSLGMPSREYYLKESDGEYKDAYLRFMIAMARLLGAEEEQARTEMTKVLEFEEELANVTIPQSERHDTGVMYRKMTVRRLQELTPEINWLLYFDSFMPTKITGDEEVVSLATNYLIGMAKLVHRQDKRLLANYLLMRLTLAWAPELTEKYQKERNDYRKILQGVAKEPVRWQKCVEFVNDRMGMAVGRLFVKKHVQKESKEMALEMIHNIRSEFINILEESNWMDEETKSVAKEKANAMIERISYPDFILNATELDKFYEGLHVSRDRYFDNILKIEVHDAMKNLNKLREPIYKDKWEQDPAVVNAFYNPNTNDIVFPAGILQPIFYSHHFPKSLNYGGIGVVIGHEITHGFDDKGRQYDKDGNLRQWWNNDTIKAFRERAQCMIDQYANYILEPLGLHIDGRNTQGENIADNGGLKESFRAYQEWVKRNGEEPPLPGINFTHNQLFFLNYAQIWCGIMRDEEALHKLRTSVHSPGPTRVIGPLSNSYDFARAYNCPVGSRMNPVKKCSVW